MCHIQTTKLAIVQLIEKVEEIMKYIRTWVWGRRFLIYNTLKRRITISIFYKTNILSKNFMPNCDQCWRKTFPHSYAWLRCFAFDKKQVLVKVTTFSSTNKTKKETKPMCDSESRSKIKIRSRWTLFKILLMSAVIFI